jgi:MarR family transcriptional regulator, organic hydroperoxide resistance regulator
VNRKKSAREPAGTNIPPLTVTRPELLVDGSDFKFRRLVHALFGFLARHEAVRSGHGGRIGLPGIDYTVLISVRHLTGREGEVTVGRLAAHLYLSGAFVTSVTNRLARAGYIKKRPDSADRRRVILEVTPKGDDLLAELAPVQRMVNDVQFGGLSADEFHQLLDIIERLIESSERAVQYQKYLYSTTPRHKKPDSGLQGRHRR